MAIPQPGKKVRGSESGSPIMAVLDLLGKRWALGIIWQLSDNTFTFRELQARCNNVSPGVLNTRIKELREADIIAKAETGYQLTARGVDLLERIKPLGEWSLQWADDLFDYKKDYGISNPE